uniref:Uncharacterized protein n=1 Tax=Romanomermis culicivorax TaxID=13658 RepID=A0A915KTB6_ROMCU
MEITQGNEPLSNYPLTLYDSALKKKIIEIRIAPDEDDPSNCPVSIFMAYDAIDYEISIEDLSAAIRLLSFKIGATKRSGNKMKQLKRKVLRELARNHVILGSGKPLQKNNPIFFKKQIKDFYRKRESLRDLGLNLKENDERLNKSEEVVKPTCIEFEKTISIIFPLKDDQIGFNVIKYEDIIQALELFYKSCTGRTTEKCECSSVTLIVRSHTTSHPEILTPLPWSLTPPQAEVLKKTSKADSVSVVLTKLIKNG